MADEKDKPVKPKSVKGTDTATGNKYKLNLPEYRSEEPFEKPKSAQKEWLSGLGTGAMEARSGSVIKGTNFLVNPNIGDLYTPIDLAKAIPDGAERAKFINDYGSKMVQTLDPNKFGVRFDREIKDLAAFKQKNYNTQMKKFLDDLDENQGFLAALGNTATKLVGKTALNVASIIPTVVGLGSALINWDSNKIFNNGLFDAWETMDQGLDKHFAVYGGSDYHTGDKDFFARMATNPMKSINADVAPAASFVAGVIITEMLAGLMAPFTGGASLIANTARLAAQGTRLFGRGARVATELGIEGANLGIKGLNAVGKGTGVYSKGLKLARGLDKVSDFENMRKIANITNKYKQALGTGTTMIRTAGYESALIARDTQDATLEKGKQLLLLGKADKMRESGASEEEIDRMLQDPNSISSSELAKITKEAENAAELSWFTNIPLVGFSNMIQFSKAFSTGYKINKGLSKLNPLGKMTGTVLKDGKWVAKAETMSKARKIAGYTATGLKSGLTEGLEEYAQGVIEHGYSDYYSSQFSNNSVQQQASFLNSMATAARKYAQSTEGQDSMTIGALMGMLGLKLPVKIDQETGKLTRGWQSYGGARSEIKELNKQIQKDKETAAWLNEKAAINPVLKANFENMAKNFTTQEEMDKALDEGDVFNYKNKEYEQYHSFVATRHLNGVGETIQQDLDALEQMSLEDFNDQYAPKGMEFTEEARQKALAKTKQVTKNIIEAHEHVDEAFNDSKLFVDFFRKNFKGLEDPEYLTAGLKEQMTFLYGTTKNLQEREKNLEEEIEQYSKGHIIPGLLQHLKARSAEKLTAEEKLAFGTNANETYKEVMANWKAEDPTSYNLYYNKVAPLLQDLMLIKERKAKVSSMYNTLFTNKGAKDFANVYQQLTENRVKELVDLIAKQKEEELTKSKATDRAKDVARDLTSMGKKEVVDAKLDAEVQATDDAMSAIISELGGSNIKEDLNNLDSNSIIKQLEDKPLLFKRVLELLDEQGNSVPGLNNVDQLAEIFLEDPMKAVDIAEAIRAILKQHNINKESTTIKQTFADPTDSQQPTPTDDDAESLAEFFNTKTQELKENSIFIPGTNVTDNSIIPITHDKKIEGGNLVRNNNGEYEIWSDASGKTTDQPVDTAKINNPNFLNNKELTENNKVATFKIADNEYNKTKNPSADDIAIDIYHGDVFIGRLPAFKQGMPAHLLALRKAVIAQEVGGEVDTESSNVEAKQNLEAKLKTLDNELAKLEKDKEAAITKAKEEDTQATVPADTTFNGPSTYLRSPLSDGSFTADQATTSPELAQSMFKLTVDANNPNRGTIEFVGDKQVTKYALNFDEESIQKVSDYLNGRGQAVESSPGIITVRKGIVEKKGDKWVVVQKAKIAFGSTNNTASSFEPLLKSTSPSDQAAIDKKVSAIEADFKNKSNTVTTQKEAVKKELNALNTPVTTSTIEAQKADIERRGEKELNDNLISVKNSPIVKWLNDPLRKEGRRSEGVSNVTVHAGKPEINWTNTSLGDLVFKLETSEERGLWVQWKEALKNKDYARKRELEQQIGEVVAKRILQKEINAKAELDALKQSTEQITNKEELINKYIKAIAEQAEIETQGCK